MHDELIFEVGADQVDALVLGVKAAMEGAAELLVPLIVDVGVGENWDQAHWWLIYLKKFKINRN